jgi:hypothetical protein
MPARPPDDPDNVAHEQEILDRYTVPDKDAPLSTGGRLPNVASDRVGPGPLPAQGREPGVAGPDGLRGGVRIDEAGELVDDRGVPLTAADAQRIMDKLRGRYDLGAAANALTDETPVPTGAKATTQPPTDSRHGEALRKLELFLASGYEGVGRQAFDRLRDLDLVTGPSRSLTVAEARKLVERLRQMGVKGAAGVLATGKSAAPGILAAALASVRKSVTSLAEITGRKDGGGRDYTEGEPGHSDELDEGEQPAPFNGPAAKGLPAAVQKTIYALLQVRKASIPLAAVAQTPAKHVVHQPGQVPASVAHLVRKNGTGAEAEADVAAALGGRGGVELGTGYNALGSTTPQVRRDGGLSAALSEIDAGRLQRMGNGLGQIAQAGLGDGLTKQGAGAGRLGAGQARVADGAHSGGSGHHGGGKGGGGKGGK